MPKPCNNSLLALSSLLFLNEIIPERRRGGVKQSSLATPDRCFPAEPPQLSLLQLKRRGRVCLCGLLWHAGCRRGPGVTTDTARAVPCVRGRGSSGTFPTRSSGVHRLSQRLLPVFLRKTDAVRSSRVLQECVSQVSLTAFKWD